MLTLNHGQRLLYHAAAETGTAADTKRTRAAIEDRYKWDLTPIYPDDRAWERAKKELTGQFAAVDPFKGRIRESAAALYECLSLVNTLHKEMMRLYCYASMHSDEDTRESRYTRMEQEMTHIGAELGARTAFIDPEILTMDRSRIDEFIVEEPRLAVYRHALYDTLRKKAHTLSEGEETILANAGLIADGPQSVYSIFSNADFPFPEVVLKDKRRVRLDKANFSLHRAALDREDRKKIFAAFFGTLNTYRRTFGSQLNAEVRKNIFFARSRRYPSCLHRALDGSNIPVEVYKGLIDNVNAHLDVFHRSLELRKRMLGVDTLHYYDLYAPLLRDVELNFSIEEAQQHTLAALTPLGDDYVRVSRDGFASRWVDVFPSDGKRSGAYSNGSVYDIHPYILLNYNGKYDDVSTLAHELGHTMHSYLANAAQEYANSHYSIFVAEVASTLNEALLMEHMLRTLTDDGARLSLLGNYLDGIRGTIFRQTQFSEFELRIHELAERGEALTGDSLNELYAGICRKYYGHDAGVCIVDDEISAEWAHVPHFYYDFYVYQYATSFTASAALSEQVLAGDRLATERYLELLKAGGSDYPIELLRRAGVDMTSAEPFELTMQKMSRVMDEIEEIMMAMKAFGGG
jgi:oligoendopeptidase F